MAYYCFSRCLNKKLSDGAFLTEYYIICMLKTRLSLHL